VGDAVRLRQVVSNLAANAIKFTAEGEVRIGVEVVEPEREGDAATLRVEVTDTGIGFDEETARRLFLRFTQADGSISRRFGGTGLGLAICKALTDLMGGEISATSNPGRGAAFTVSLPLPRAQSLEAYDRTSEAEVIGAAGPPDLAKERLRILLAEDHPVNQRVAELILEPAGVDLTIVPDGQAAVEAFQAGRFDLILMDMQMPVMDGLAATREIRRLEALTGAVRTPLAMLTANAMHEHVEQAQAAGADHLIAKPITPGSLTRGIDETFERAAGIADARPARAG
jgi:CheY-like chemotaxis protein/anti-sigma regulatory factor (Ser/Thr protein kinase)